MPIEKRVSPLEEARDKLRYQAQAQIVTLSTKDCRDLLLLIDWAEAIEMELTRRLDARGWPIAHSPCVAHGFIACTACLEAR